MQDPKDLLDELGTIEQGRAPLVDREIDVTFESEHNFYTSFTKNISSGGLFIATQDCCPVATILNIRLTLPGLLTPVETKAVVRWTREVGDKDRFGMGLKLLDLP